MFLGHRCRKFSKIRMSIEVKASDMFLLFTHRMISVVCALELKYYWLLAWEYSLIKWLRLRTKDEFFL